LFASADANAVRRLHRENPRLQLLRHEDRVVASEPPTPWGGRVARMTPITRNG
jgi:hypothetical protein